MQHTIAAVFDKQSQAQQALDDLLDSGFFRRRALEPERDK